MRNEVTSLRVARIAAKGLSSPTSLTKAEVRIVCASALTQALGQRGPSKTMRKVKK